MIRLTLLGGLGLVGPDGQNLQPVLSQPKRLALLAYIALAGPGAFRSRDSTLVLFWPDATEGKARRALNQTLHFLRQSLGADVIVSRGSGEIGVSADEFWCDAVAFDRMIRAGDLAGALHLYSGELLPGFFTDAGPEFDQWLSSERSRLQRAAFTAAWKLAEAAEKGGQFAAAAEWGRMAVDLSLNDETTARALIDLLDRIGDRAGALQAYGAFAARLAREYETRPSAELREFVARIRTRPDARPELPHASSPPGTPTRPLGAAAVLEGPISTPVEDRSGPHAPNITTNGATADRSRVPTNARRLRRYWLSAAVLMAAVGAIWIYLHGSALSARHSGADEQRASIIVRELTATGSQRDSLHLEQALTSAIVDQLTQVRSFNVISIPVNSALPALTASGTSAPRILLTGNVVRSGPQVRVNIQIADAETGRTIKTAALDHPSGELLPLVDSLALQVSSLVRAAVGHEVLLRSWSASAKDARVYGMMQQADEHSDRATRLMQSGDIATAAKALWSADSTLGEAEGMAPRAAELMIEHSRVLARLSALYLQPSLRNYTEAEVLSKRSVVAADNAVAMKPSSASALENAGSSRYWYWLLASPSADSSSDRVLAQAERSLRSAVRADPRRASAWSMLSSLLVSRGDQRGAYLAASRAYEADAYMDNSPEILSTLFLTSYEMGSDSLSASWCDELNRRFDHSWAGAHCRLALLAWGGTTGKRVIAQAWQIAANGSQHSAGNRAVSPYLQMLVAAVIARNGFPDSADAVIGRARAAGAGDPELLPFEADARMRLGQNDAATALVVAYVRAKPRRRIWLARSRRFANLKQLQRQLADVHYPAVIR